MQRPLLGVMDMKVNQWASKGWWVLMSILLAALPSFAQKAEVYTVGSMPDNSIIYALPLTQLYIEVEYEEVDLKPGELSLYAQRYLGVNDVTLEPQKKYVLKGLRLNSYGTPNEEQRYSVKFGRRHDATNVSLSPEGILLGINAPEIKFTSLPQDETIHSNTDNNGNGVGGLSPEYIQATTIAKKAEIAAQEIYEIRENKTLIVSGQSEQPFADGKALEIAIKRLDESERILMERFLGTQTITKFRKIISGLDAAKEGKVVALRFSEHYGVLPADDLRGEPIYLNIKIVDQAPSLDEKAQKKLERSLSKGIVFSVPGAIEATLTSEGNKAVTTRFPVAQLGTLEVLESELFTTKGKITTIEFYSETGGIKEVKTREEN